MGLFRRKKADTAELETHMPLHVLGWNEMRMLDPRMSPEDVLAAQRIAESAVRQSDDVINGTLDSPRVDAQLQVLIPGLLPLGGFPANPDEVAIDFVTGWGVATAEEQNGLAAPGMISKAAQMALSIVRPSAETEGFAKAMWQFIDLGYCANRLGLDPDEALRQVHAATV